MNKAEMGVNPAGLDVSPVPVGERSNPSTKLYSFLAGRFTFTELEPFTLPITGRKPVRRTEDGSSTFSYYLATDKSRDVDLRITVPLDVLEAGTNEIYAIPVEEKEKGEKPYYWLEFYGKPSDSDHFPQPFSSARLVPDAAERKIDFLYWHGIEEQLLADFLSGRNGVQFSDLSPFSLYVRNKVILAGYRIGGDPTLKINLLDNSSIQNGDTLTFKPQQDEEGKYQWLDILKVDENIPEEQWLHVSSYRLLPDEHRLTSKNWFGLERQLLLDFMGGEKAIHFNQLKPIRATKLGKGSEVNLLQQRSSNISVIVYLPSGLLTNGDEITAVPKQDDQQLYQWFDVYQTNQLTGEQLGECIASLRLDGKTVIQKGWQGPEIQLLHDFSAGKLRFENLRPIPLVVGNTPMINLWKDGAKKVYFVPSSKHGLIRGASITLLPQEEKGDIVQFTLIRDNQALGMYTFNKTSQTFRLEEVVPDLRSGWYDEETGIYTDQHNTRWTTAYKLYQEFGFSYTVLPSMLDGVSTLQYTVSGRGSTYFNYDQASAILREAADEKQNRERVVAYLSGEDIAVEDLKPVRVTLFHDSFQVPVGTYNKRQYFVHGDKHKYADYREADVVFKKDEKRGYEWSEAYAVDPVTGLQTDVLIGMGRVRAGTDRDRIHSWSPGKQSFVDFVKGKLSFEDVLPIENLQVIRMSRTTIGVYIFANLQKDYLSIPLPRDFPMQKEDKIHLLPSKRLSQDLYEFTLTYNGQFYKNITYSAAERRFLGIRAEGNVAPDEPASSKQANDYLRHLINN